VNTSEVFKQHEPIKLHITDRFGDEPFHTFNFTATDTKLTITNWKIQWKHKN